MDQQHEHYRNVQGWGADLDPNYRPAFPKERQPARFTSPHWETPEKQTPSAEILVSADRQEITPVFGTTLPPKGKSGQLRKKAFQYTDSDLRHWFLLIVADRVDVFEGIIADFKKGHVPNVFKEMGLKSELKYNKKNFFKNLAIAGFGIYGLYRLNRRA